MSNPWEKYNKESEGVSPWQKYSAPTESGIDKSVQQPIPQLTSTNPSVDVPQTRDLVPMLKEAGQTLLREGADVAQGLVEGPGAVISGAASFIPAVLSQAPTVLGGVLAGKPTAGLAAAKEGMDSFMESFSFKPKSRFGQTVAEVAASPFTVAHEGIETGVKALGGSDEQVKAGQFVFDSALVGLPHVAKKIKRGEKLTPKEIEEVKVATPDVKPDILTDVLSQVGKLKPEVKKGEVPVAKFPENQFILEGLQKEVDKRTGPRRASYQKALDVVRDHGEDIGTLDMNKISKAEGKVRKLVQKLKEERDAQAPILQDINQVNKPSEILPVEEVQEGLKPVEQIKTPEEVGREISPQMEYLGPNKIGEITVHEWRDGETKGNFQTLTTDPVEVKTKFDKITSALKEPVLSREQVAEKYVGQASPEMLLEPKGLPTIETPVLPLNFVKEQDLRQIRSDLKQKLEERKAAEKLAEETKVPETPKVKARTAQDLQQMYSQWKTKKVEKLNEDAAFNNLTQENSYTLYHGNNVRLKSSADMPDGHRGYFATEDPKVASKFGKNIHEVKIPKDKIFDARNPEHVEAFIKEYKKKYNIINEGMLRKSLEDGNYAVYERPASKFTLEDLGYKGNWQVEDGASVIRVFNKKDFNIVQKHQTKTPMKESDLAIVDDKYATFKTYEELVEYAAETGTLGRPTQDPLTKRWYIEPEFKELEDYAWDSLEEVGEGGKRDRSTERLTDEDSPYWELSDTGTRNLWDVFNNERGSVDVTDLKIAADKLKRIEEKAKSLGKSVEEMLDMIGVEPETARKIMEQMLQLPQMQDEVRKADPIIEGIINPDPSTVVMHRNSTNSKGRKNVPLTAKTFQAIHSARKLEWGTSPLGKFMAGTETRIHAFERYGKGVKEEFFDKWLAKLTDSEKERRVVVKEVKDFAKTLTTEERRAVSINAIADQKGGLSALAADGIKEIPPLTPKMAEVITQMRERYDKLWDRINYVRSHIGLKPLPKLDNYFPFIHKQNALRKAGVNDSLLTAPPSKINGALQNFKGTFFPFDKPRKITDIPLELDIFNAFETYMGYAMKEIHVAPIAALAKEAAVGPVKVKGVKLKKGFRLMDRNPGLGKLLLEWSDEILGIDPSTAALTSKLPTVARGFSTLHKNVVAGMIFGNLRTVMVQPTALKGVASLTTFRDVISGVGKMMLEKPMLRGKTEAALKSNVLSVRSAELILTEIAEAMSLGKVVGVRKMAYDITSAPMNFVDAMVAESGWNAGYGYAKRVLKLDEGKAVQWADDLVMKTQGAGIRGAVSPIQSVSSVKWLTMLQTYAIADFNFIARDLLGIKNPDITKTVQTKRVLRYLTGAALVNMTFQLAGIDAPNPSPIQAFGESKGEGDSDRTAVAKAMMEFLEVIPIIGGSAKYSTSLLGPLGELATQAPEALEAAVKSLDWEYMTDKEKLQTKLLVGKVLGLGFGIPMTNQIAKSIRTSSNGGDWYEILLGIYVKAGKGTPPRPPQLDGGLEGGLSTEGF